MDCVKHDITVKMNRRKRQIAPHIKWNKGRRIMIMIVNTVNIFIEIRFHVFVGGLRGPAIFGSGNLMFTFST